MAQFVSFALVIISVLAWQIFSVGGCGQICLNNVCCSAVGSTCAVTSDCCSPLSCANNVCCSSVAMTCELNSDCCSKSCNSDKVCCAALGNVCNSDPECCSGFCNKDTGVCEKYCVRLNLPCVADSECCVPLPCNTESKTCCAGLNLKSSCNSDADCCSKKCILRRVSKICCVASGNSRVGQGNCCSGVFRTDPDGEFCCSPTVNPCSTNFECCQNNCQGGICTL